MELVSLKEDYGTFPGKLIFNIHFINHRDL
jgi:hypothetical protein